MKSETRQLQRFAASHIKLDLILLIQSQINITHKKQSQIHSTRRRRLFWLQLGRSKRNMHALMLTHCTQPLQAGQVGSVAQHHNPVLIFRLGKLGRVRLHLPAAFG